jgi:PAS domain S-box-containing protein
MAILDNDGLITQANIALCTILGFSRAELIGLSSSELIHSDDIETDAEQRRRLHSGEIDRYQLVQRFIRRNGEATWVLMSVSIRRRTSELPQYYLLQAESADRHLSIADRTDLDALVDRVGEAMHEIGNTLTPLMVNTELIVERSKTGAARRIAFALRRLRGLTDSQAVAYLGPDRMLDLRTVAPPTEEH